MSIKSAVQHIHDELRLIELKAKEMPEELYQYAIAGIHRDIEVLWNRVSMIYNGNALRIDAAAATDTQPIAQNAAVVSAGTPPNDVTLGQVDAGPNTPL